MFAKTKQKIFNSFPRDLEYFWRQRALNSEKVLFVETVYHAMYSIRIISRFLHSGYISMSLIQPFLKGKLNISNSSFHLSNI